MFGLLLSLSLVAALGDGTVARQSHQTIVRAYECALGIGFSVRFDGRRATVDTRSHRYELTRRPFSLGPRYGSDTVAFAQDEDRAVLIGAEDGPYRDCREIMPDKRQVTASPASSASAPGAASTDSPPVGRNTRGMHVA